MNIDGIKLTFYWEQLKIYQFCSNIPWLQRPKHWPQSCWGTESVLASCPALPLVQRMAPDYVSSGTSFLVPQLNQINLLFPSSVTQRGHLNGPRLCACVHVCMFSGLGLYGEVTEYVLWLGSTISRKTVDDALFSFCLVFFFWLTLSGSLMTTVGKSKRGKAE